MEERSVGLERAGTRTQGWVVDTSDWNPFVDTIQVRFSVEGHEHNGQIVLDSDSPEYQVGDRVVVLFDPIDPSRIRTTQEANDPMWWVIAVVISFPGSFLLLATAVVGGWRARAWRRLLQTYAWSESTMRYGEVSSGRSPKGVVELGRERLLAGVAPTGRWRLRRLADASGGTVWVAGDPGSKAVLSVGTGGHLFGLHPARTRRQHRRWTRALAEGC